VHVSGGIDVLAAAAAGAEHDVGFPGEAAVCGYIEEWGFFFVQPDGPLRAPAGEVDPECWREDGDIWLVRDLREFWGEGVGRDGVDGGGGNILFSGLLLGDVRLGNGALGGLVLGPKG